MIQMLECFPPSRPYRLGTHRRRAERAESAEGSSRRRMPAPSLDTGKHLATTCENLLRDLETKGDKYEKKLKLWRRLTYTVYRIWQNARRELESAPVESEERAWWEAYEAEQRAILVDESPEYELWLEKYVARCAKRKDDPEFGSGHSVDEKRLRQMYLKEWIGEHPPSKLAAKVLNWEAQYFQLFNCQSQWVGYKADCCGPRTRTVAVPIGCGHRLCPLCSAERSRKAELKSRQLFDRLQHPQFLTLTASSTRKITKRTFNIFRRKVRQLMAAHKEYTGGVYALETTYNRTEKSWHVHAHVLVDCIASLPSKDERVTFAGRDLPAFTLIKMALEFDWSRLWIKALGKAPRKNASTAVLEGERYDFEMWVRGCFENPLKEFRGGVWRPIQGLPPAEMKKRAKWNRDNRRVLWIKPVDDREKAAREVLKYITKSADFCDLEECVEGFYNATKSARLIQTFGSWYGFDPTTGFDTEHLDDWREMKCTCGKNEWSRIGVFYLRDVQMDTDGKFHLRWPMCRSPQGTVPRPRIRALGLPEKMRREF